MFIKNASAKTGLSAMYWLASSAIRPLSPGLVQQVLLQLESGVNSNDKRLSETGMVPGCSVRLLDLADQTEIWLSLVYPHQAKPEQGSISVLSPLGAALLGKNVGELVQVQCFRRTLSFMLCDLMAVKQQPKFNALRQEQAMRATLPEVVLSSLDLDRLEQLLDSMPVMDPARLQLEQELNRALVLNPSQMPANVVTMNSKVRFRFLNSNEESCLSLVYPKDLDGAGDKVSVLAPVGSALLGLSEGDQIDWPVPDGGIQSIKVLQLIYQPERSGQLHR